MRKTFRACCAFAGQGPDRKTTATARTTLILHLIIFVPFRAAWICIALAQALLLDVLAKPNARLSGRGESMRASGSL
jgi:hypothetical protein